MGHTHFHEDDSLDDTQPPKDHILEPTCNGREQEGEVRLLAGGAVRSAEESEIIMVEGAQLVVDVRHGGGGRRKASECFKDG